MKKTFLNPMQCLYLTDTDVAEFLIRQMDHIFSPSDVDYMQVIFIYFSNTYHFMKKLCLHNVDILKM